MINLLKSQSIKEQIARNPASYKQIIEAEEQLGICVTDTNGYFVDFNARYLAIYGYNKTDLLGHHFTKVVREKDIAKLDELHQNFMKQHQELLRFWDVMRKDGKQIKISADAGYFENILNGNPCKITIIHEER